MSNGKRKISAVLAAAFTTFAMLGSMPFQAQAVTKKVVKAPVKKVVVAKKPTVNTARVNLSAAQVAANAAEAALKKNMTDTNNVSAAEVALNKAYLAITKVGSPYLADKAKLTNRMNTVKGKIEAAISAIEAAKQYASDLNSAKAKVATLESAVNDLSTQALVDAATTAKGAAATAIATLKSADKASLQAKVDAAQAKIDAAIASLQAAKDYSAKIDAATTKVASLETAVNDLSTQALVDGANKLVSDANGLVSALKDADKTALQARITAAQSKIDTASAALAYAAKLDTANKNVAALEDSVKDLSTQAKVDSANGALMQALASLDGLKDADKTALQTRVTAAQTAITTAQAALITPVVKSVSATNGTLTITMDRVPATTPVAVDFAVTSSINGAAAAQTTVSTINYDGNTVVTLTVPQVSATDADQNVVYSVSYKGASAVNSDAVKVAAKAITTVSVAPITVEENKTAAPVVSVKDQYGNDMTSGYTLGYSVNNTVASVAADGTVTAAPFGTTTTAAITVTATPTTGAAITATAPITVTQDTTKPAITNVQALNNKTIVITYSEKVDASALNPANYTLYDTTTGKSTAIEAYNGATTSKIQANFAFADSSNKVVKMTIVGIGTSTTNASPSTVAGYPMGGLTNANYILYTNNVQDIAATPNAIVANSASQFAGTLAADANAPQIVSASYDTGLGILTLNFDKAPQAVSASDGAKYSIVNGNSTVALTNDAGAVYNVTGLRFNLTADQVTALSSLQSGATLTIAANGIQDAAGNKNASAEQVSVNATVRPRITSASYDENTHKLTVNFSKGIKSSAVAYSGNFKLQYSTDGTNFNDVTSAVLSGTDVIESANAITNALVFDIADANYTNWQAQRATTNVTYRLAMQDNAVTDGTVYNMVGGTGWQTTALSYNKEVAGPVVTSVKYYTDNNTTVTPNITSKAMYITFDSKLAATSAFDKLVLIHGDSNTELALNATSADVATAAVIDTTFDTTGKTVKVVFQALGGNTGAITDIVAGKAKISIKDTNNSIKDVNGNIAAVQQMAVAYINNAAQGAVTATAHSTTQIYVTLNTNFDPSTVKASNFTVYNAANVNDTVAIDSVNYIDTNNDGINDTVVLTSHSAMSGSKVVAFTGLKDSLGNAVTDGKTASVTIGTDSAAPSLLASSYKDADNSNSVTAGDQIILTFDEPVAVDQTKLPSAIFGSGATAAIGSTANSVVVTLGSGASISFGTTKLDAVSATNYVTDASGNAAVLNGTNIPTPTAAVGAQVVSAVYADTNNDGTVNAGDTLTVKFNKSIAGTTLTNVTSADFTGITLGTTGLAVALNGNDTLVITLGAGASASVGTVVDVNSSNDIMNSWNMKAVANSSTTPVTTAVKVASADATSPILSSASLTDNGNNSLGVGDVLTLTFSEPVDMTTPLAASDFNVTNGTLVVGTIQQVNPTTVAITLGSGSDITINNSTIDFKGFGTNKVTDAASNQVIPSVAKVITNKALATIPTGFVIADNATTAQDTLTVTNAVKAGTVVNVFDASTGALVATSAAADTNGSIAATNLGANTTGTFNYLVIYVDANGNTQIAPIGYTAQN